MGGQKDWDDYAKRYVPDLVGAYHSHRLSVLRDVIFAPSGGGGAVEPQRWISAAATVCFSKG